MMRPLLNPAITDYLTSFAVRSDDAIAREMEAFAVAKSFPIIGPLVGKLVFLVAKSIDAKRIFELGSGFGYSAYWFAKAVGPTGAVTCTDGDKKNAALAEDYLRRAGLWNRITFHVGMAQEHFTKTKGEFDIIYNDVDKNQYPHVFELVASRVRSGGFYIADNALWSGRVVEKKVTDDVEPGWTEAIRKHNDMVFAHPEFEASIVPLRDGVVIARRR